MSLNSHGKQKISAFCRIHGLIHVLRQHYVFGPPVLGILQDIHELLADIRVKAQMIVHIGPAVEITAVVVESK